MEDRRRLVWPPDAPQDGDRRCQAIVMDVGPGSITYVRECQIVQDGSIRRYAPQVPLPGLSSQLKVCGNCGVLLELWSGPQSILLKAS